MMETILELYKNVIIREFAGSSREVVACPGMNEMASSCGEDRICLLGRWWSEGDVVVSGEIAAEGG